MKTLIFFTNRFFDRLMTPLSILIQGIGDFLFFFYTTLRWMIRRPYRFDLYLKQMEIIGVHSLWIVLLVGAFSGAVFALQIGHSFKLFNAESLVGSTVAIALSRELAPVFTALMVIARAGSAMAAELGTMQVTEQVDALKTMAVNPIHYLVVPRLIASVWMLPLLTGLFDGVGILGSYLVGVYLLRIPEGPFLNLMDYYLDPSDILQGLIKAFFFGCFLSLLSTWRGLSAQGGAEGVGRATTQAVVISSVTILILDFFLTTWVLEFFPKF